ncbi:hypothetical protein V496_10028 [Pseudogymnoascus sp. VKM F-4515 (FW-2607)]|nr:hypothetical protein V496_10028 [Pseudogymnoascus sp. VKM F-4515 (FW-2607)]KFY81306.1 hypothetical protein V498_08720 [Pseudogymnoascus sp. VKM F-4517 (FW-2822)]
MSTFTTPKTVLVIGATGKQGGAVIENILASSQTSSFSIVVVTRDANSRKAQMLAAHPNVSTIEGDLANADDIINKAGSVSACRSTQTPKSSKPKPSSMLPLCKAPSTLFTHQETVVVTRGRLIIPSMSRTLLPSMPLRSIFNSEFRRAPNR